MPEEEVGNNAEVTMYNLKSDQLFIPAHDSDGTWNEQAPIFVGMTLTANDSDDDDETPESGDKDVDNMDDNDFFTKLMTLTSF